jgi:tetratricopeptide (TPR) repeat protein
MTSNNEAYQTLKQWQKALKLTDQDTESMNASVSALQPPPTHNSQDVQLYERMLEEAMRRQFPLSDRDTQVLANLQQVLHLSDLEVRDVRDRLLMQLAPQLTPAPANASSQNPALVNPAFNVSAEQSADPSASPILNPTIAPASAVLPQTVISKPPVDAVSAPSAAQSQTTHSQNINKELVSKRKLEMEGAAQPSTNPELSAIGLGAAGAGAIAASQFSPQETTSPQAMAQSLQQQAEVLLERSKLLLQGTSQAAVSPPVQPGQTLQMSQTEVQQGSVAPVAKTAPSRVSPLKTPWYRRPEAILGALFAIVLGILGGAWLASRSMNQISRANPQEAQAFVGAANTKIQKNDYSGAIEDYSKAISLEDNNAKSYLSRGSLYHRTRDLGKAESDFDRAISLNSNMAEAYNNRSHVRFDQGKYDDALKDAEQAIALNPSLAEAYLNRGNVRFVRKSLTEAEQDFKRAIELKPNAITLARAYNNLGNVAKAQNNLDSAIRNYDQATQLDSQYADAFFNRALALEAKTDTQAALRGYRDAANLYQAQGNDGMRQRAQARVDRLQQGNPTPATAI